MEASAILLLHAAAVQEGVAHPHHCTKPGALYAKRVKAHCMTLHGGLYAARTRRRSSGAALARSCARRSWHSARRRRRPRPRLRGPSPACSAPQSGARGARRRLRRPTARRAPALGMPRMHLACYFA